jgi:hypothetical protein
MALFSNFVQSVFKSKTEPDAEPITSNPDDCKWMVVTTHKLSGKKDATLFDTDADLMFFMKDHCPTAHLLYIRSEVFRMDLDEPAKLVEQHEHCTGNVDWETGNFNDKAASMGLDSPRVATYPNISSAVTAVAYFN